MPPSWVGSAVSNSVVYLAAERIQQLEINNMRASLVWGFFANKILGPNWDANSWQDVPQEDTIS